LEELVSSWEQHRAQETITAPCPERSWREKQEVESSTRQRGRRLTARWRILVTKDLLSHLDRLVLMVPVDHLVHMAPAVDHLVTHPDLLSSPAQAREQPARRVRWTQTMWSRRTEASGSGLRSARSGSGRQRPEPSRLRQLSRTLARRTLAGQCCPTALGLAKPPPGLPTLRQARGVASWEVSALGLFCQAEENKVIMEATTLDGSPDQMEPW
jgi:hypothetical protein